MTVWGWDDGVGSGMTVWGQDDGVACHPEKEASP